jgi:hypothetical protein
VGGPGHCADAPLRGTLARVGISRFVAGLLLDDDDRRFLARLRRERQQEPRIWAARILCALGVTAAGFGTGYWLITVVLAAFVLAGKRPNRLASACVAGLIFAASFVIAELVTGANRYAFVVFGVAAILFALGLVLLLRAGVTLFGHSQTVRGLRRGHDVNGLIVLLGDSDPLTRSNAADALGALADLRAELPLLRALGDPNPDVRANAARALGVLKSGEAVEPLVHALRDGDGDVC